MPYTIDTAIIVVHNCGVAIRFTKSARKHRIGRTHARYVIEHPTSVVPADLSPEGNALVMYLGTDTTGRDLEVGVVVEDDNLVVIHVMPMRQRWR